MTTTQTPNPAFPMNPNFEMETMSMTKRQTPSSKIQRSSKHQTAIPTDSGLELGAWSLVFLWCLVFGSWNFEAKAELPEPDNIIYGIITRNGLPVHATDTDVVLEARRNSDGAVVASYRMGDSARTGDNFTLRIPLEVFTPVFDPLSSLTGTAMTIVASDFNGGFAEVPFTMGGRGQFHQLNISHFARLRLRRRRSARRMGDVRGSATSSRARPPTRTTTVRRTIEEYLAGTDPNNANSRFRLQQSSARVPLERKSSFVAQAAAGNGYQSKVRTYTLEWTTNLNSNRWTPLTGYIGVSGRRSDRALPGPAPRPGHRLLPLLDSARRRWAALKGVPPVGEPTDELIRFLESGDTSLRSRWHHCAMLRNFNSSGGASTPG
jgi:hypothetical protein